MRLPLGSFSLLGVQQARTSVVLASRALKSSAEFARAGHALAQKKLQTTQAVVHAPREAVLLN